MKKNPLVSRIIFAFLILPLLSACAGATPSTIISSTPTTAALFSTSVPSAQPPAQTATTAATNTAIPTEAPSATPTSEPLQPLVWNGTERPLLMAHYMPWYQAPPVSAEFGYHWTMNHFYPKQNPDGSWTNLASYTTPLTGPYDSSDDTLLEYQVMLMKLSGIDGVIVDWYGTENFNDYATINDSTIHLFKAVKKAGLKFAICYEDQTVRIMVDNGHIAKADAVAQGQKDMLYLQKTWFTDIAYLKLEGKPILLNFGPQYFMSTDDWDKMFSTLPVQPFLITLNGPLMPVATSAFPWPPMSGTAPGSIMPLDTVTTYLTDFYQKAKDFSFPYIAGGAFPAFHDIYAEAGVQAGYAILEPQNGHTFNVTLQEALNQNPNMIQLITWNDYGEGTIIEPTVEFGYQYLEIVQETRKVTDANFSSTADDLRLPLEWYNLSVKLASDPAAVTKLDQAFNDIIQGDLESASSILKSLQ